MSKPILFMGDTSLDTAASYLAGCLANAGWEFDYIPTGTSVSLPDAEVPRKLFIVSDFPASEFPESSQQALVSQVVNGAGLLMIGGWESFQGLNGTAGGWCGTSLSELLPVEISNVDDRENCDFPVFVIPEQQHSLLGDLPWTERPPLIGGYNRVAAKSGAKILLKALRMPASMQAEEVHLTFDRSDPLLVIDDANPGRRAALMTDLAPHWIGPMVDWGTNRVSAQAPGAEFIEVGYYYMQFVQQLISWVGRFEKE